ncbi:MAG: hypothetical protein FJ028_03085 [Chloroflexi bacterium]|nr:hypothetical protein [Chloroflexota bacterium]
MRKGARYRVANGLVLIASIAASMLAVLASGAAVADAAEDAGYVAAVDQPDGGIDPYRCVERVGVPAIENALEAVWSPGGTHLAFTRIVASNSGRTVTGYEEDPGIGTLEVATGRVFIVHNGRHIRTLEAGQPEVRWVGEQLLYWRGPYVRAWSASGDVALSQVADEHWPMFPRDWAEFSADGHLFSITRYFMDGQAHRYVGQTLNGHVTPLDVPGATYTEWAPTGQVLLVRSDDHKALLMGRITPTVPAGPSLDRFQVWAGGTLATATLPNLLGARSFSPDGRHFAGVARTGLHETALEVYRCGTPANAPPSRADPVSRSRQARIDEDPRRFVRPPVGSFSQFLHGAHTGVDIAAPFGSLITAADEGRATYVGWRPAGGRVVCVQHDRGTESRYYHGSLALVRVGRWVWRGEPIAAVGMTGLTPGPHVHWEVKASHRIVDPIKQ